MVSYLLLSLAEEISPSPTLLKRLDLVPFDKISESGDGGRGRGYLHKI